MKIVCLGDSITWGFPWGPEQSWVKLAADSTGIEMINKGVNGETTDNLRLRFARDVILLEPSHVIIMIGTNDASFDPSLKKYANNCHAMIESAKSANIKPALGLPIPSNDFNLENQLEEYRHWIRDYAAANEIAVLDFSGAFRGEKEQLDSDLLIDEVHPSKRGYRKMAGEAVLFINYWFQNVNLI